MTLTTAVPPSPDTRNAAQRWRALSVLLLVAFMDFLDNSIVFLAVPSIQRELGATFNAIEWITAGYALAFALTLIPAGRLGDIFGHRKLFLFGVAGFTLSSLACGLAPGFKTLIAFRLLQGVAAGTMIPQILSLIHDIFPPEERAKASGAYGAVAGLANLFGPILGGLLLQGNVWGLSWRPIFLINIPIGIAVLWAVPRLIRKSEAHPARLDGISIGLLWLGLGALMYPLLQGQHLHWPLWLLGVGSVGLLALLGFLWRQKRVSPSQALVTPALWHAPSFLAGSLICLLFFVSLTGFFFSFALYQQIGLGWSPLKAGLIGLPWALGIALTAPQSFKWVQKWGVKVLMLGIGVMMLGLTGFYFVVPHVTPEAGWPLFLGLNLLGGLGMGMVISPLFSLILKEVPRQLAGTAAGVINALPQLGTAVGIAAMGSLLFHNVDLGASRTLVETAPVIQTDLRNAAIDGPIRDQIVSGLQRCLPNQISAGDATNLPAGCTATPKTRPSDPFGGRIYDVLTGHVKHVLHLSYAFATRWNIVVTLILLLMTLILMRRLHSKPGEVLDATIV